MANVNRMIEFHNQQVRDYQTAKARNPKLAVDQFIDTDPAKISWNRADKAGLTRNRYWTPITDTDVHRSTYRPFTRMRGLLDRQLDDMITSSPDSSRRREPPTTASSSPA